MRIQAPISEQPHAWQQGADVDTWPTLMRSAAWAMICTSSFY
jgi:hypothetical protein